MTPAQWNDMIAKLLRIPEYGVIPWYWRWLFWWPAEWDVHSKIPCSACGLSTRRDPTRLAVVCIFCRAETYMIDVMRKRQAA